MKTRADKIKEQMRQLEMELKRLAPHETMSGRELARHAGVSPTTATRFKEGDVDDMQMSTLKKLMPFTNSCPLCQSEIEVRSAPGLQKFVQAQDEVGYDTILEELRAGRKRGHWMWFVFPQVVGLGYSDMNLRFSLMGLDDAKAYMEHPVLGPRLLECTEAVINNLHRGQTLEQIFDDPVDAKKFRSSMTLFISAANDLPNLQSVFDKAMDLSGQAPCMQTLQAVKKEMAA